MYFKYNPLSFIMDYIISFNGLDMNTSPKKQLVTRVTPRTSDTLHDIASGKYITSLDNYNRYINPIVSSNNIMTPLYLEDAINDSLVIRYNKTSDVNIQKHLTNHPSQIQSMIHLLSNILIFLSSNDITHSNINVSTILMDEYERFPLVTNFSKCIINRKYNSHTYNPSHYWKCPTYHLFCYILNQSPNQLLSKDVIASLTNDIVDTALGVMLPFQYVTCISTILSMFTDKSYGDIRNEILTQCKQWDIYSMHIVVYECSEPNTDIHETCKKYITNRSDLIFK